MTCPKCGNELGEGNMYCEICGEEIHIVPDFEPEIEKSMSDILTDVADQINPDTKKLNNSDTIELLSELDGKKQKKKEDVVVIPKNFLIFGLTAIFVIFIICGMLFYKSLKNDNSAEYQIAKGDKAYEAGQYSTAIAYYEHAKKFDDTQFQAYFKIAKVYENAGNIDKAIDSYIDILTFDPANKNAIEELIRLYQGEGKSEEISKLILNSVDEDIKDKYKEYISLPPVFSIDEGTYDDIMQLELLVDSKGGSIYYTLDGSEPGSDCILYENPITLRNGIYEINAIYVNANGIISEMSTAKYEINSDIPDEPIISLADGTYEVPQTITVIVPADSQVYYTTDKTEPNSNSAIYLDPIAIPNGKSYYRFVSINSKGYSSEIIDRNYDLNVKCNITEEQAIALVQNRQFEIGRVIDGEGNVEGGSGKYLYSYNALRYVQNKTFHFVSEYYQEGTIRMVTGNLFAVDVYDGSIYQAVERANNTYSLIPF